MNTKIKLENGKRKSGIVKECCFVGVSAIDGVEKQELTYVTEE